MIYRGGLGLSQRFYQHIVATVLAEHFPDIPYAAARIGWGSEILGYDDDLSTDHDFGPCVQLFLDGTVFPIFAEKIMQIMDNNLPETFEGYKVHYSAVTRAPDIRQKQAGMLGSTHGVELYTVTAWSQRFLQRQFPLTLSTKDWLCYPEQFFLMVTAGAVFRDDTGELTSLRKRLSYFPPDVWLYKLAVQWGRIAAERAYVGRAGSAGDDIGYRLIASHMVENIMRLAMLIEKQYIPYAKWFGSAFCRLHCASELAPLLKQIIQADHWTTCETALITACQYVARLQLNKQIAGATEPTLASVHNRPFQFIDTVQIADSLRSAIKDKALREMPEFGAADQFIDSHFILSVPDYSRSVVLALLEINNQVA